MVPYIYGHSEVFSSYLILIHAHSTPGNGLSFVLVFLKDNLMISPLICSKVCSISTSVLIRV